MKLLHPIVVATALLGAGACARGGGDDRDPTQSGDQMSRLVQLLADGEVVFGMFAGARTEAQGVRMGANRDLDFVFYSLESGPFDIGTMRAYMHGLRTGSGTAEPRPVALRIPAIRAGRDEARTHATQGLAAGVRAVVFPHVENADDAALAVELMGEGTWPGDPAGDLVNMLIIEDQVGIENARAIVSTPGVSVAIPGPGDLRRAFAGDMDAVERAIQRVLAACKEFDVACGITAGVDDIAARIDQGFRVFILSQPEALAVGRVAAGRSPESGTAAGGSRR